MTQRLMVGRIPEERIIGAVNRDDVIDIGGGDSTVPTIRIGFDVLLTVGAPPGIVPAGGWARTVGIIQGMVCSSSLEGFSRVHSAAPTFDG